MPNILPTDIKKFKEAVDWFLKQTDYPATKVKILVELYQATNPLYPKGEEFSGDTGVSGGICTGMALEWIKKNSTIGGDDAFRKLATTDWETFAFAQINIKHQKLVIKSLTDPLLKQFQDAQSGMNNLQDLQKIKLVKQEMVELTDKVKQLQTTGAKMYSKRVLETGNPNQEFTWLSKNLVLSQVVTEIQKDQGSQPTFYLVNVNISATQGHSIAIHAAAAPRLLDANSCEFSIDSMTTLYAFLADYWQIYERCGYQNARVEIFRFDV
ncbi:MAG TPA: YopT-type cysteine protease domain-containing protein [Terracidiphilus sp.]|nr:YopT-type cysteine protease domain-containing protein [Terracidiphilus sp.]